MTSADVAHRAGVSTSAVSYAFNGRPGISDETRARIHAAAKELGWRPNSAARALTGARAGLVGLVIKRPARSLGTEAFYADLIAGLQAGLQEQHVALSLLVASDLEDELAIYREWTRDRRVDGVVLTDPRQGDARLDLLAALGLPAVVLGNHPSPPGQAPTVWIDDGAVTTSLLEYLWALGHRRIARVSGPEKYEHTLRRTNAMAAFLAERDAAPAEVIATDYSESEGAHAARYLLSRPAPPTAVVFDSDVLAVAGLGVAQEMGVRVPRDLSIASFDDSAMARLVRPRLTTMSRDTVEFGERAARLLLRQLDADGPVASEPGPVVTLSVRDSTAPPAAR
ncbi:LacI family transcriptional regulator [Salana multivorans]|uniref:LacI family transcriptional regulator n=1 Tax=Salana multivorans TaxID=120377 RepID=A0A3N2D9M3_9MICO|nr:LacI family DNA-binding transcriptional regulator [Salana multivorans]ROR96154.1 LacI family transcriptional regulator [Salana multivorans]